VSTLVVSYSFTGTVRHLASTLCADMGWASGEISETRPGRGTWRCMVDSLLHRRPAIKYSGPDPSRFDTVVLVAPVWIYRLCGPMRTFVFENKDRMRQTAFVSVMGQSGGMNAAQEVANVLGRPPAITTTFLAREVNDGTFAGRLHGFAKAVQALDGQTPPLRQKELSPVAS